MKKCIFSFLICISFSIPYISSQDTSEPISIGNKYTLNSEVLDQERPILVYLPRNYEKDSLNSYPVMYLLDGGGNFHHTTACVRFLAKNDRIPDMIVVGIPNTDDRTRDLTPPTLSGKEQFPTAGGADSLVKFIDSELIPFIEGKFRTNAYKMLTGHSFGGLFAIHTLVQHPDIFNSYIAISPSLWWDNQVLVLEQSEKSMESNTHRTGHLYMTMGNEGGTMLGGALKFSGILEEKSPENFHWDFVILDEETHGSIPHMSTYKGLEFIFKEWNINERRDEIIAGGIDVLNAYEKEIKTLYGFDPKWDERQLIGFGRSLTEGGYPSKAASIFEKTTKLFPDSEMAWSLYGESLAQAGDKEKAAEVLKKAINLNPENLVAQAAIIKMGMTIPGAESISISPQQFKAYTGDYNLNVGPTLVISTDGKQLFAEAPILEKEALVAIGDHRFFVTSKSSTIFFELEDEKIIGLNVKTPDGDFSGKKKTEE